MARPDRRDLRRSPTTGASHPIALRPAEWGRASCWWNKPKLIRLPIPIMRNEATGVWSWEPSPKLAAGTLRWRDRGLQSNSPRIYTAYGSGGLTHKIAHDRL